MLIFLPLLKGFLFENIRDGKEKSPAAGSNCLHEVWLKLSGVASESSHLGFLVSGRILHSGFYLRICFGLDLFHVESYRVS